MGKGSGSGRGYGVGPGGVSRSSATTYARDRVSQAGGAAAMARAIPTPMAASSYHASLYQGASTSRQANAIAAKQPPVSIVVSTENGRVRARLGDGRHRALAAQAAGATRIPARIIVQRPGRRTVELTTTVRV